MKEDIRIDNIVLQPTTLCNLDCDYCYLRDRQQNIKMSPLVPRFIARALEGMKTPTNIVWHGGEPLATGLEHFQKLLRPFETLRQKGQVFHQIQTNATLITDEWCKLFLDYDIHIGVSLDGTEDQTKARVNWGNKPAYPQIVKGIKSLKNHQIPFSALAVVNAYNIDSPREFYDYFINEVGCEQLGINVEEKEGLNEDSPQLNTSSVRQFWSGLWDAWVGNPKIEIREFKRTIEWLVDQNVTQREKETHDVDDFWPTVSTYGDVVLLSPEFASVKHDELPRFIVGNVLTKPITDIIQDAGSVWYVQDHLKGIQMCSDICPYFSVCHGGFAVNKFFENGIIASTETDNCRNSYQAVTDIVLAKVSNL